MELSFDGAELSTTKTTNYLSVGNHKIKCTKVEKGTAQTGTPYVAITVQGEGNATCEQKYHLTEKSWNITKNNILTLVAAAQNCDQETAKSKLAGLTMDNIDMKLSSLLVGKSFAIKLNGKWVNPTDTSKPSYIISEFGSYAFAVPLDKFDTLSTKDYIKGENASAITNTSTPTSNNNTVVATEKSSWS